MGTHPLDHLDFVPNIFSAGSARGRYNWPELESPFSARTPSIHQSDPHFLLSSPDIIFSSEFSSGLFSPRENRRAVSTVFGENDKSRFGATDHGTANTTGANESTMRQSSGNIFPSPASHGLANKQFQEMQLAETHRMDTVAPSPPKHRNKWFAGAAVNVTRLPASARSRQEHTLNSCSENTDGEVLESSREDIQNSEGVRKELFRCETKTTPLPRLTSLDSDQSKRRYVEKYFESPRKSINEREVLEKDDKSRPCNISLSQAYATPEKLSRKQNLSLIIPHHPHIHGKSLPLWRSSRGQGGVCDSIRGFSPRTPGNLFAETNRFPMEDGFLPLTNTPKSRRNQHVFSARPMSGISGRHHRTSYELKRWEGSPSMIQMEVRSLGHGQTAFYGRSPHSKKDVVGGDGPVRTGDDLLLWSARPVINDENELELCQSNGFLAGLRHGRNDYRNYIGCPSPALPRIGKSNNTRVQISCMNSPKYTCNEAQPYERNLVPLSAHSVHVDTARVDRILPNSREENIAMLSAAERTGEGGDMTGSELVRLKHQAIPSKTNLANQATATAYLQSVQNQKLRQENEYFRQMLSWNISRSGKDPANSVQGVREFAEGMQSSASKRLERRARAETSGHGIFKISKQKIAKYEERKWRSKFCVAAYPISTHCTLHYFERVTQLTYALTYFR